jgi:hypothetical protein
MPQQKLRNLKIPQPTTAEHRFSVCNPLPLKGVLLFAVSIVSCGPDCILDGTGPFALVTPFLATRRDASSALVLRVPMSGPGGHADTSQALREGPLRAESDPELT